VLKVLGRFAAGVSLLTFAAGAGLGLAFVAVAEGPAGAVTTITVNDASDTASGTNCTPGSEGDCPLRAALVD